KARGNAGIYNECFALVELSEDDTSLFYPVKKEFVLPVPEQDDIGGNERLSALRDWLAAEDSSNDYFCDFFTEEIRSNGWRVFIPNRVPAKYDEPDGLCAFISIF
ncbi:MAG: hypothetical protein R3251_03950, partial [Candidatus Spechtbacterales bacterium]|nr:hypothetical protein [Candidatus Spechtbacterales bacterium]